MDSSGRSFAEVYSEWLTSRLSVSVQGGVTEITTPLLDPMNDGMRVYVEPATAGYLLHDGGLTLETLSLQGVDVSSTERRRSLAEIALKTCGLVIADGRLQTEASEGNLPQRMHFLLCGMHRISDLWLTTRGSGASDFFERVCSFLDERQVLYSTNVSIPGRTVAHPVDIVVPLPRRGERLIKLIGTPNVNAAKVVSFTWMEISEVRPTSERVVLVNDESAIEASEVRALSAQTTTILTGYSTSVFHWSQRASPGFEALWRVAA